MTTSRYSGSKLIIDYHHPPQKNITYITWTKKYWNKLKYILPHLNVDQCLLLSLQNEYLRINDQPFVLLVLLMARPIPTYNSVFSMIGYIKGFWCLNLPIFFATSPFLVNHLLAESILSCCMLLPSRPSPSCHCHPPSITPLSLFPSLSGHPTPSC